MTPSAFEHTYAYQTHDKAIKAKVEPMHLTPSFCVQVSLQGRRSMHIVDAVTPEAAAVRAIQRAHRTKEAVLPVVFGGRVGGDTP